MTMQKQPKRDWLLTLMMAMITAFTGGTCTLLGIDHEKIWDHEVRLTVLEKNSDKPLASTAVIAQLILPKKIKTEPLK
jgi:hypothetical protein